MLTIAVLADLSCGCSWTCGRGIALQTHRVSKAFNNIVTNATVLAPNIKLPLLNARCASRSFCLALYTRTILTHTSMWFCPGPRRFPSSLFCIKRLGEVANKWKRPLYIARLDMSKAFDKVCHRRYPGNFGLSTIWLTAQGVCSQHAPTEQCLSELGKHSHRDSAPGSLRPPRRP